MSGREPGKRTHGAGVAATLVGSELPAKVGERVEAVGIVETFLVFPVAAFHFSVMAGRIGADQLVADTQLCCGGLEQGRLVASAAGKSVSELKAVVRLHTFNFHSFAGKGGGHLAQKISG